MSSIETVVRPAQSPDTSPPKTVNTRRTVQNWQPVVLKWGVGGSIQQASGSESAQFTQYQVQKPKEKQA